MEAADVTSPSVRCSDCPSPRGMLQRRDFSSRAASDGSGQIAGTRALNKMQPELFSGNRQRGLPCRFFPRRHRRFAAVRPCAVGVLEPLALEPLRASAKRKPGTSGLDGSGPRLRGFLAETR